MKSFFLMRSLRAALISPLAMLAVGCSIAPGPYMGVVPAAQANEEYSEDVSKRADIFSITPNTIEKMVADRNAALTPKVASAAPVTPAKDYQYRVGAQDILQITVWNHPELSNPAATANEVSGRVVDPDGHFFFPYAGRVPAAGRTISEIRRDLTRRLAGYLVEPQIDVGVAGYRSKRVFVVGQVVNPGPVAITDVPLTVTDLITQSGGLTPEADLRNVRINRQGKLQPIDLYALYYQGDMSENVVVKPEDILTIPENSYNKVFVLGEVNTPQSIVMPRGRISLAEAISDSGGFNPLSANAGQVYVIRKGLNNRPQIWHLNSRSPDALILAESFDLEARDIVYVDPANVARWGRVLGNILPSASFLTDSVR